MKIEEIKDPQIRALAWKYKKANKHEKFNKDTVFLGFNWKNTKEGGNFWLGVDKGKPVEITEKMKQDHPEIFLKQEEEMKNEFNFKVGDKLISPKIYKQEFIEITAIGEETFIGKLSLDNTEHFFSKKSFWQLYQPTPEKVKLTKFYCSAFDYEFIIIFLSSKERAKELGYKHVYSEREFLDKFDVKI